MRSLVTGRPLSQASTSTSQLLDRDASAMLKDERRFWKMGLLFRPVKNVLLGVLLNGDRDLLAGPSSECRRSSIGARSGCLLAGIVIPFAPGVIWVQVKVDLDHVVPEEDRKVDDSD